MNKEKVQELLNELDFLWSDDPITKEKHERMKEIAHILVQHYMWKEWNSEK